MVYNKIYILAIRSQYFNGDYMVWMGFKINVGEKWYNFVFYFRNLKYRAYTAYTID